MFITSSQQVSLEKKVYTEQQLSLVDVYRVPTHVAIIMDGNRRWAKQRNLPYLMGHWQGAKGMMQMVRAASALGIKVLTVYAFSTENWRRSAEEVAALMFLFKTYLINEREEMVREGVKLNVIGDLSRLPLDVKKELEITKKETSSGTHIELVLALNYGGRDDIRRAVLNIVQDIRKGKLSEESLSEELLSNYLDTAEWEDPQLLIRTSGERRLSNFLLWQLSYTEVYVSEVLWPDFNEKHLLEAIVEYQQRERRLGE